MSGADEQRAAKRQKLGTEGFSVEPDLEVAVEGEVVAVQSVVLMLASPVFKQMLSHGMAEAASGRIELPGKSASEFKVFLEFLQPGVAPALTEENVMFLAQWCDEYQVLDLKGRCEEYLVDNVDADVAGLVHATKCNLKARKEECAKYLQERIDGLELAPLKELEAAGPSLPAEVLELVWPNLCKAAGVPAAAEKNMPSKEQVIAIIPFAASAVASVRAKQAAQSDLNEFKALAKTLPVKLAFALPSARGVDARDALRTVMRNLGFELN